MKRDAADRFWSKVDEGGPIPQRGPALGRCWVWTAYVGQHGYGSFFVARGKPPALAHRWAYESEVGEIPEGAVLDHLCVNPVCVRPSHLDPVTQKINVLRSAHADHARGERTACVRGHDYTGANVYRHPVTGHPKCRECSRERDARRTPRGRRTA